MRFIRTTNNIAEFIETNDLTGQIINSMGFQFGEVYFLIKGKKVTFYLNDSEKPFDNFIWSIDIPFTLDDVLIEDADQASAALHNVFNDRFQEQLDELRADLEEEIGRSIATDEALQEEIDDERDRAISAETYLQDQITAEVARSVAKDAEHDAEISALTLSLENEIQRAISAETILHNDLNDEIDRALAAESAITVTLNNEITRSTAKDVEHDTEIAGLTLSLENEVERATNAENALDEKIDAEIERAFNAESALTDSLNAEILRSTNADAIQDLQISGLTDDVADLYATKQNNLIPGKYVSISGDVINVDSNHVYRLTQAAYDALSEIDAEGLYIITDAPEIDLSWYTPLSAFTAEVLRSTTKDFQHDEAISGLTTGLTTEIQNRLQGDNLLQENLTNEVNRAISAETELHDEIINERDRAIAAESGITVNLNAEIARALAAESAITVALDGEIQNRIDGDNALDVAKADKTSAVASANYDSANHTILLKNISGTVLSSIDCAPFIVDGMVDDVRISGGNLVISFNTDAGKQDIVIPLTDIFNPANYYLKSETDALLATKVNVSDFNSYSASTKTDIDGKLAISDFNSYSGATADKIADKLEIADFNSYSATTKASIDGKLATADFNTYSAATKTDIDSISATVETLEDELGDDYYKKSETSGATEIANALNGKQDTLVSTVNIKTINGESVLGSGNIHIESETSGITSGECQQMIDASIATKQNILTAGTGISIVNDVISVTATSPSVDAYTKAESDAKFATITNFNTHSADTTMHVTAIEKNTWNNKQNQLTAGENITISGNVISASGNSVVELTQAEYDALPTKNPKVMYVITDAPDINLSAYTLTSTTDALNTVVTAHTADSTIHITSTERTSWNGAATNSHTHSNKSALDAITGNVGTMAYENKTSYSSATEVNTALGNKVNTSAITTAITSSSTDAQVPSAKAVYDQVGGLKFWKGTQAAYDAIATKDNNTIYFIKD